MGRKKSKNYVGPHVENPLQPATTKVFIFHFTALR